MNTKEVNQENDIEFISADLDIEKGFILFNGFEPFLLESMPSRQDLFLAPYNNLTMTAH